MAHEEAVRAGIEAGRRACNFIMPEGAARAMFAAFLKALARDISAQKPGTREQRFAMRLEETAAELSD